MTQLEQLQTLFRDMGVQFHMGPRFGIGEAQPDCEEGDVVLRMHSGEGYAMFFADFVSAIISS